MCRIDSQRPGTTASVSVADRVNELNYCLGIRNILLLSKLNVYFSLGYMRMLQRCFNNILMVGSGLYLCMWIGRKENVDDLFENGIFPKM